MLSCCSSGRIGRSSFLRLALGHFVVLIVTISFSSQYLPRRWAGWANGESETRRLDPELAEGEVKSWWSTIPRTQHSDASDSTVGSLPISTSVHCVGENYSPTSWKYRSCHFKNLCYDLARHDFVATESSEEHDLRRALAAFSAQELETITLSTLLDSDRSSVSLGTTSTDPWFPKVVAHNEVDRSPLALQGPGMRTVSALSDEVVLVPISVLTPPHSSSSNNNNVIWDVLYPVYTLLSLFGLEEKQAVLLILDPEERVGGARRRLGMIFEHMDETMMILAPQSAKESMPSDSMASWICSNHAVAGLGLRRLNGNDVDSDDNIHISNSFAWNTRSVAEGISLWAFRSYLVNGLRIQQVPASDAKRAPIQVAILGNLQSQFSALRSTFPADQVRVHRFTSQESVTAIASSISASRVLVTSMDKWRDIDFGLLTFLPRDSYLLLLVDNVDSINAHSPYGMRKMDWDLLNAAGYFHVRVLPLHDSGASVLVSSLRNIVDFVLNHS